MGDFGMDLRVIDEQDNVLCVKPSEAIHKEGLLHRALHILVFNSAGELYVRERSPQMELYPGVWTTSVGEHVFVEETYDETAHRALREFLGLETPVSLIGKTRVHDSIENELVAVYTSSADAIPHLNKDHSAEGHYLALTDVQGIIDQGKTTPHLAAAVQLYGKTNR